MKATEQKSVLLLRHHLKALRLPTSELSARRLLNGPQPTTSITSPTCSSCSSSSFWTERREPLIDDSRRRSSRRSKR